MSTEALKLSIINKIMNLEDLSLIKEVDRAVTEILPRDTKLSHLVKPMRKELDIETIKEEQQFKVIDKKEFLQKFDDLEIEEPIEELLEMI